MTDHAAHRNTPYTAEHLAELEQTYAQFPLSEGNRLVANIKSLRARVEQLEAALRRVESLPIAPSEMSFIVKEIKGIARAALSAPVEEK